MTDKVVAAHYLACQWTQATTIATDEAMALAEQKLAVHYLEQGTTLAEAIYGF